MSKTILAVILLAMFACSPGAPPPHAPPATTAWGGHPPAYVAAKDTVKRLSGTDNFFLGTGVTTIDAKTLEGALWDRLVEQVIKAMGHIKSGKEDFALDGIIQQFHQRPSIRPKLRALVVEKLGRDPFPPGT